tara:strand:- start:65 stop:403 length:339 start_codon:yes stop_codon:yes gene_type:complete
MTLLWYIKNCIKGVCPNCKKGKIFLTRFKIKNKCESCKLNFIEDHGDNWFFLLIIDRAIFIFPIIVAYYFNSEPKFIIILSLSLLLLFIIFTPIRLGISLAFVYYLRTKIKK